MDLPEGARCAVTLTYDDGLACHSDHTAPLLDSLGLRATFYVPIITQLAGIDPARWRAIADAGHELGNHSVFHPCRKDEIKPWVQDCYDLKRYTPEQWRNELAVANYTLALIDGRDPTDRTYGNNCCELTIGDGEAEESMKPILRDLFVAARGPWNDTIVDPAHAQRWQLGHFSGDHKPAEVLEAEVQAAVEAGGWLVFMVHGVGKHTHEFLWSEADEHRRFVEWLAGRDDVWVAPPRDVAEHTFAATND